MPLPELPVLVHEIRIRNQVLSLSPPLEEARATWIRNLFDWLGASGATKSVRASQPRTD